jgi:DNA-binding transcriptional LysR family regulator
MKDLHAGAPIDGRLLQLFDELYRTRSVTRAAERLGLAQPTVSISLGRLRRRLQDPLFVRTPAGMQPTPRADALISRARQALELLQGLPGGEPAFDPAGARRDFRICMTDASHITLLPRLLAFVRSVAPRARIEVASISEHTERLLESGGADLAIGFVPGLDAGFYQQTLYWQDFVCLVNPRHPHVGATLSVRDFLALPHVAVLSRSYSILDRALGRARLSRRVQLELPGFLGLATIIASSDLVATVPRMIGEALAQTGALRVYPCPVPIPKFAVKQYWHARYHNDAGNRWLRSVCAELFSQQRGVPRKRAAAEAARGSVARPPN